MKTILSGIKDKDARQFIESIERNSQAEQTEQTETANRNDYLHPPEDSLPNDWQPGNTSTLRRRMSPRSV